MDTKKLSEISIIFIGIIFLIFILQEFQSLLRPLTLALLLSFLFTPMYRISKKEKYKQLLKTIFSVLLLFAFLLIFSNSLINRIGYLNQNNELDLHSYLPNNLKIGPLEYDFSIANIMNSIDIMKYINILVDSITSFFSEVLLIIVFMIFIIPSLKSWITKKINISTGIQKNDFLNSLSELESILIQYFKTKTMISIGTATISFLILISFGNKLPLLFALLIFLFNYIPNIGSIFAVAIVMIFEFAINGFSTSFIILGIILTTIQFIFGNIIEPKYTSKKIDISALSALLSLLFWGAVWGIGGMLFSIPLTIGLRVLLKNNKCTKGPIKHIC